MTRLTWKSVRYSWVFVNSKVRNNRVFTIKPLYSDHLPTKIIFLALFSNCKLLKINNLWPPINNDHSFGVPRWAGVQWFNSNFKRLKIFEDWLLIWIRFALLSFQVLWNFAQQGFKLATSVLSSMPAGMRSFLVYRYIIQQTYLQL